MQESQENAKKIAFNSIKPTGTKKILGIKTNTTTVTHSEVKSNKIEIKQ